MAKRVVVLGSGGQLGLELVQQLRGRGYEVTGWEKGEVDITDAALTERKIAVVDPKLVINSAAYNQVDVAEREPLAAFQVNALAVRSLAVACRQVDARLVHFSTDYVFDGRAGRPYTEEDRPHPMGAYAVSKYAGELYAQAYLEHPLIVRTSGVFGPGGLHTARGNFIELMLRMAASGQPIRVVEDHVASPTFAPELARRTIDLAERDEAGVFHVGGGTPISWFDYARMIFNVAGINAELQAINEREYRTLARRPRYSALSNARMEAVGLEPMPPLRAALQEYFRMRQQALSAPAR